MSVGISIITQLPINDKLRPQVAVGLCLGLDLIPERHERSLYAREWETAIGQIDINRSR